MTIDDVVKMVHPDYVAVNNPAVRGVRTPGTAVVVSFEVDNDVDGVFLYVTIAR